MLQVGERVCVSLVYLYVEHLKTELKQPINFFDA